MKPCTIVPVNAVAVLLYRNLVASIDKVFLVWQVVFPIIYIFIAGYSYSALLGGHGIAMGSVNVPYPAYLAAGMMGFNMMNSSTVAGSIIWNDKKNGMFKQILVMPFARMEYVLGNIVTIMLMGLASAGLILLAGSPTLLGNAQPTIAGSLYVLYALIVGAVFFGSIAIIISTRLKSSEGFNVIVNSVFLFFSFASSAFYPSEGVPTGLGAAFYANPLTYIVDITRAGIFNQITLFTGIEMGVIAASAAGAFLLATISILRMRV
ncbi:MAG TPA: ABC transporter permease [Nitrososphaera sp.]|nr:ABC transporter permease [Nitrososphaera sp.]